jgi:WD40 repeat protein
MKIQLLIALPEQQVRTPVLVEDTLPAGACAADIASQLGYPVVDATGIPIAYRLYSGVGRLALPDNWSLADLAIQAGTCLLLDCVRRKQATLPVARSPLQPTRSVSQVRPWTRRSLLTTALTLGGAALAGLGSGWSFALASHALSVPSRSSHAQHQVDQIRLRLRATLRFTGHQKVVRTVAWSPGGTLLASGGDDARVLVWSPNGVVRTALPQQAPVQSLAWSPEGSRLMTGAASRVAFFSALSGNLLAAGSHRAQVTSVAWARSGQMLAASGSADRRVIVWQTAQYQAQTFFAGHTTAIEAVTFDAAGQTVASSSQGGAVRVWAAANGEERHPFYLDTRAPIPALSFAPVGTTLAAGGFDGEIRLWNGLLCKTTGASDQGRTCTDVPMILQISKQPIRALAWSPEAAHLASGHENGTIVFWSPAHSRTPVLTVPSPSTLPVHAIAWSPDGKRLAEATGTTVTIWDLVS